MRFEEKRYRKQREFGISSDEKRAPEQMILPTHVTCEEIEGIEDVEQRLDDSKGGEVASDVVASGVIPARALDGLFEEGTSNQLPDIDEVLVGLDDLDKLGTPTPDQYQHIVSHSFVEDFYPSAMFQLSVVDVNYNNMKAIMAELKKPGLYYPINETREHQICRIIDAINVIESVRHMILDGTNPDGTWSTNVVRILAELGKYSPPINVMEALSSCRSFREYLLQLLHYGCFVGVDPLADDMAQIFKERVERKRGGYGAQAGLYEHTTNQDMARCVIIYFAMTSIATQSVVCRHFEWVPANKTLRTQMQCRFRISLNKYAELCGRVKGTRRGGMGKLVVPTIPSICKRSVAAKKPVVRKKKSVVRKKKSVRGGKSTRMDQILSKLMAAKSSGMQTIIVDELLAGN